MKKMILGMMLVAGLAAYGDDVFSNGTRSEVESTSIPMVAYSSGALVINTTGAGLDFKNLRAITSETAAISTTIKVKDENQTSNLTSTAKLTIAANSGLTNQRTGYNVPVLLVIKDTVILTGTTESPVEILASVNSEVANAAPVGNYAGSFIVRASFEGTI